ncbi:uncharacterized protein DNG_05549 [Cephalotrichum gorgonifer]|uniref:PUM-HD domain-containing protein n=1 Tax=Cephalotrichum gorgonifer TaxID=2041049 RepID=A0AAE8MY31_9PEZI|nr:uncharacterized protein DNG_05549 [Cephalotrichum gorgonifer]
MASTARTTRPPSFGLASREETHTGLPNIWAVNRRDQTGPSWARPSAADDDVYPQRRPPTEPIAAATTSIAATTAEDSNWGASAWAPSESVPASGNATPRRTRDPYRGSQDQSFRQSLMNGFTRTASLLDDDSDHRGFRQNLNGSFDMDPSRRQDGRPPTSDYPGLRAALGEAPSRDSSLPPSRGTNGSSPSMPERFTFAGGHTPSNSIGMSRAAIAQAQLYPAGPSNPSLPPRSFDSVPRQGQQDDDSTILAAVAALSLGDRPTSSANGAGFNPGPHSFNPGVAGQGWPGNGSTPATRYLNDVVALNNSLHSVTQSGASQYATSSRGSMTDRVSPTSAPGASQSTPPQDSRGQQPLSRDLAMGSNGVGRAAPVYVNHTGNANQAASGWFLNPYLTPDFASTLQAHTYGTSSQRTVSNSMIPGYPVPVNPYMPGAALAAYSAGRNQDPTAAFRTPALNEFLADIPSNPPGGWVRTAEGGVRSALLDEFRESHASSKWDLKHIYGHIVAFSKDQLGSRFVQDQLDKATKFESENKHAYNGGRARGPERADETDPVMKEIVPHALELMKNQYGNYVIQKLFDHSDAAQKKTLTAEMKGQLYNLSVDKYGCRVVQKALDRISIDERVELVRELESNIVTLMNNEHGNHVVQKIVELLPREHLDFIMEPMRGHISTLSTQQFACRVVQRMLEQGTVKDKADIFSEVHAAAHLLISDPFGNYVAQRVPQLGTDEDKALIAERVIPHAVHYSKHKFASNVVEQCILHCSPDHVTRIRNEFTTGGPGGESPLGSLMRHQYGNYVIQKMLKTLQGAEHESFALDVQPHLADMKRDNQHSKQVLGLIQNMHLPSGAGQ